MAGRWAEALAVADAMIAECEAGSPHVLEDGMHAIRGEMRDVFGDADGALADHLRAVALAREKDDPVGLSAILGICAAALADRGSEDEARSLVDELVPLVPGEGVARWDLLRSCRLPSSWACVTSSARPCGMLRLRPRSDGVTRSLLTLDGRPHELRPTSTTS